MLQIVMFNLAKLIFALSKEPTLSYKQGLRHILLINQFQTQKREVFKQLIKCEDIYFSTFPAEGIRTELQESL